MQEIRILRKFLKQTFEMFIDRGDAGRALTIFPDDIFIVSYLRSGNTWTRFLIGNLLFRKEPVNFSNIEYKIPDIYQNHDYKLLRIPRRRCLKSHEYFDSRYKTVIYIVRNPKDVLISYYYYSLKVGTIREDFSIEQFTTLFTTNGLDSFGSWGENVGSWLGAREADQNFLLIKYEDLLDAPERELRKISEHLQIECDDSTISYALRLSSFEQMQKLEKLQAHLWKPLKNTRADIAFVRKGKQKGWQEKLSETQAKRIDEVWGTLMMKLGYIE